MLGVILSGSLLLTRQSDFVAGQVVEVALEEGEVATLGGVGQCDGLRG